jgi:proline iminopeptidase
MKTNLAVIVWVLFMVSSAFAQRVNNPADVQAIQDASAAWDKAWSAGDCETLALLYTADAIAMGPNAPAQVGRDAIRASCRKYFSQFREVNRSRVEDVRISGYLAVARGTQVSTTSPKAGGKTVQNRDKWITVYQRQPDGSWKILWEIYNSDLQATASPPSGRDQSLSPQAGKSEFGKHPSGDYVLVNRAKLWYESEGKGPPLVLISGGPGAPHNVFHPWFSALADHYRVICFDAFGRGKSDRARSPKEYTFDRDVEDLEGLRKALGFNKMAVLGFSYGGLVAQAYALKHPARVDHLILADTLYSGEMWQEGNDKFNAAVRDQFPEVWAKLQQLRSKRLRSSAKEVHQLEFGIPWGLSYFHDASVAERLPSEVFAINPQVYYAIAGDDADFQIGGDIAKLDFRARLKNLPMPVLVITGRYDRFVFPRLAVQFKKYAPQAKFVMLERAGHFSFIEAPDGFFAAVRAFLNQGSPH